MESGKPSEPLLGGRPISEYTALLDRLNKKPAAIVNESSDASDDDDDDLSLEIEPMNLLNPIAPEAVATSPAEETEKMREVLAALQNMSSVGILPFVLETDLSDDAKLAVYIAEFNRRGLNFVTDAEVFQLSQVPEQRAFAEMIVARFSAK